jgi:putative membrane protein
MLYLILALFLGVLSGTLTGLIPGIHINLIAIILLGFSATLLNIVSPLTLIIFITAMAITHTFIDYIPSIFLGAPDEDSILSVLPGHQLLLKGHAYFALIFTLYGSLSALIIILFFTPIFIYLLPKLYPYVARIMWIILLLASIYLISSEGGFKKQDFLKNYKRKLWALIIFLLAGFLGIASLNLNIKEPLLPLLTGLFGASNLIISIKQKTKIPKQKITKIKNIRLRKKSLIKSIFASIIASPFTAFLPGLGASQAALIGKEVSDIKDQREFLFLLGAINTIVMGLSFIALYSIQKTRTGAAVAISKLIPELTFTHLVYIILTIILSGIIAFFITIQISKLTAKHIHRFNYSKLSIIILVVLLFITIYFTGFLGLLVFIISAFLGITTILLGIKRLHLMGALLIPTILFYLL